MAVYSAEWWIFLAGMAACGVLFVFVACMAWSSRGQGGGDDTCPYHATALTAGYKTAIAPIGDDRGPNAGGEFPQ
ncbi:TPA: hypothetical protein ACK3RK_006093 [Burkholderia cepacia]